MGSSDGCWVKLREWKVDRATRLVTSDRFSTE